MIQSLNVGLAYEMKRYTKKDIMLKSLMTGNTDVSPSLLQAQ